MTRTDSNANNQRKSCATCQATEIYSADKRLDQRPLCWDCWEKPSQSGGRR